MKKSILILSFLILATLLINHKNLTAHNITESACIVCNEQISDSGIKYKYLNKEVLFCCGGCAKTFKKEPANYLKDGLHCPICSEDDAKKDISHTHEDVKYYFCGNGCKKKFEGDAQTYLNNYNK